LTKIREAIRCEREERVLLKNYRKDGAFFWNELYISPIRDADGRLTHFVGIQNDVTIQVESALKLNHLAHHDALTGLVNRGFLVVQLQQSLLRARRSGGTIAVLFFDLDNFKHVNDVLGHGTGDQLLQIVAERLKSETRGGELVARLGGDEFVVVLENFSDERRAPAVMDRLASRVSEPVDLLGQVFHPSASVGMALFPQDGDTPETLLKVADFRMYIAKHNASETQPKSKSRAKR
jgi:diguanylate cyclase (GGDEF)-like protein